jgi:exosortase/archaeosortase family protein
MTTMPKLDANPAAILALEAVTFWPVWIWWTRRILAEPEAAWGLAALAVAITFVWRQPARGPVPERTEHLPHAAAALVAVYALACWLTTPIFSAAIAVVTIAITLLWSRPSPGRAGVLGLCVIALPVTASLQFVAGFPMRRVACLLASWMLTAAGAAVEAEGTGLRWSGGLAEVDVPCSGIHMLWVGLFFALAAACIIHAGVRRTAGIVAATMLAVVLGNALRTAGLFYLEAGLLPVSPATASFLHTGAGLAVFGAIASVTTICARC